MLRPSIALRREAFLDNDNDMMSVDCRKTRAAEEKWKRDHSKKLLKDLGPPNQRLRITGKAQKGALEDFARVRRVALAKFANECGHTSEVFEADPGEFARWNERKKAAKASKELAPAPLDETTQRLIKLKNYTSAFADITSFIITPRRNVGLLKSVFH